MNLRNEKRLLIRKVIQQIEIYYAHVKYTVKKKDYKKNSWYETSVIELASEDFCSEKDFKEFKRGHFFRLYFMYNHVKDRLSIRYDLRRIHSGKYMSSKDVKFLSINNKRDVYSFHNNLPGLAYYRYPKTRFGSAAIEFSKMLEYTYSNVQLISNYSYFPNTNYKLSDVKKYSSTKELEEGTIFSCFPKVFGELFPTQALINAYNILDKRSLDWIKKNSFKIAMYRMIKQKNTNHYTWDFGSQLISSVWLFIHKEDYSYSSPHYSLINDVTNYTLNYKFNIFTKKEDLQSFRKKDHNRGFSKFLSRNKTKKFPLVKRRYNSVKNLLKDKKCKVTIFKIYEDLLKDDNLKDYDKDVYVLDNSLIVRIEDNNSSFLLNLPAFHITAESEESKKLVHSYFLNKERTTNIVKFVEEHFSDLYTHDNFKIKMNPEYLDESYHLPF